MTRFQLQYNVPASMAADAPNLGEGVSRPLPDENTRLYTALVSIPGEQPMRVSIRAASPSKAKLYGTNRWPKSNIIIIK